MKNLILFSIFCVAFSNTGFSQGDFSSISFSGEKKDSWDKVGERVSLMDEKTRKEWDKALEDTEKTFDIDRNRVWDTDVKEPFENISIRNGNTQTYEKDMMQMQKEFERECDDFVETLSNSNTTFDYLMKKKEWLKRKGKDIAIKYLTTQTIKKAVKVVCAETAKKIGVLLSILWPDDMGGRPDEHFPLTPEQEKELEDLLRSGDIEGFRNKSNQFYEEYIKELKRVRVSRDGDVHKGTPPSKKHMPPGTVIINDKN